MSAAAMPSDAVQYGLFQEALERINERFRTAVVSFTAEQWTGTAETGYTLTIAQSVHGRTSGAYIAQVRHTVDGVATEGTWAAVGTRTAYDSSTGAITLTAPTAFDGTITFI